MEYKDHNSKTFTLIELLIVVAIIGMLASILLSSLSQARNKAKVAVCASNLDQRFKAQSLYMMDSHNRFMTGNGPEQNYTGKKGTSTSSREASARKLDPYLCTNLQENDEAMANLYPSKNGEKLYEVMDNSYAMNHTSNNIPNALTQDGSKTTFEIEDPSRMVFMYEWAAHHVVYKTGGYDNIWSLPLYGKTGRYVINFVDGHVSPNILIYPGLFSRPDHTWSNGM
ncbi:MAG: prepilin-type N-terminal cleavage/methylation domain-containing protein [Lentisphaeraceae bacterium]|nr:prepilin-type N-terminal cleavage/methylation domain-containing protein [Lentisphaeraceae bacterium]